MLLVAVSGAWCVALGEMRAEERRRKEQAGLTVRWLNFDDRKTELPVIMYISQCQGFLACRKRTQTNVSSFLFFRERCPRLHAAAVARLPRRQACRTRAVSHCPSFCSVGCDHLGTCLEGFP